MNSKNVVKEFLKINIFIENLMDRFIIDFHIRLII